jgi:hypothetical protein
MFDISESDKKEARLGEKQGSMVSERVMQDSDRTRFLGGLKQMNLFFFSLENMFSVPRSRKLTEE